LEKSPAERNKFILDMKWMIYIEDNFNDKPFGYIKIIDQFGLKLQMFVFPPDFIEFCQIMKSLNEYTQYSKNNQ
jgi:hypothetical protein